MSHIISTLSVFKLVGARICKKANRTKMKAFIIEHNPMRHSTQRLIRMKILSAFEQRIVNCANVLENKIYMYIFSAALSAMLLYSGAAI